MLTEDGSETEIINNKIVIPYNARLSDKNHQLRIRNKALMPVKKNM